MQVSTAVIVPISVEKIMSNKNLENQNGNNPSSPEDDALNEAGNAAELEQAASENGPSQLTTNPNIKNS